MDDVTAMDRYESSLAQSMQAFGPQVADTYDVDKAAQKRAEILGIPVELMRDQREIDQIRQQRSQAEAEAAQREAAARALSARPEPGQANKLVDQITQ
ncbi:hypothetical protein D9M72_629600 [compost metagenome]